MAKQLTDEQIYEEAKKKVKAKKDFFKNLDLDPTIGSWKAMWPFIQLLRQFPVNVFCHDLLFLS